MTQLILQNAYFTDKQWNQECGRPAEKQNKFILFPLLKYLQCELSIQVLYQQIILDIAKQSYYYYMFQDNSLPHKTKMSLPKGRGSFIAKLLQIMKTYPDIIHWTDNGLQIKISDVEKMEKDVIPTYYRHSNINSFVRQLNMYYFSKFETSNKNEMFFQNENFRKGNESNFHLIQRRNKGRDQLINKIHDRFSPALDRIHKNQCLPEEAKEMLTVSIEYQQIASKNLEKIKTNITLLSNHMKNSRSKQIKQITEKLKSTYNKKIVEIIENGKKIDEFIRENLCAQTEFVKQLNSQNLDVQDKLLPNREFLSLKNINFRSECSILNFKSEISFDKQNKQFDEENEISFQNYLEQDSKEIDPNQLDIDNDFD